MATMTQEISIAKRVFASHRIPSRLREDAQQELYAIGLETNWDETVMDERFSSWLEAETSVRPGSWEALEANLQLQSDNGTLATRWQTPGCMAGVAAKDVPSLHEIARMVGYENIYQASYLERLGLAHIRQLMQLAATK